MIGSWIFQVTLFLVILLLFAIVLGEYMAKVFAGKPTLLSPIILPIENGFYKIFGVNPQEDMDWKTFAINLLLFNLIGLVALFALQELQQFLPLNPQKLPAVKWHTAINTAISYVTNTNWQSYKSENTMSYLTQMLGMNLQNFLSAATGIAVGIAFIQGFIRKSVNAIGNFWVYLTRAILYILLPLAIVFSLIFVSQGVVQNFNEYAHVKTLEGTTQVIAQGPAASQIAIKHLGTNGGGFFAANSAHPYENPTPLTDYLEIYALLIIAAAFPFAFGALVNNRRQGYAIFLAMFLLYFFGLGVALWAECHGNPLLSKLGITHGVNLEGKEVRLGTLASVVFAHASTATSTGAVNALHDSFMPLSGLVLIFNMAIGEVVFGGVGVGFIGMLLYAILSMFLIGLMVGRSPEIYGKKLEPREMILTVIALFVPAISQLIFDALAISSHVGVANLGNPAFHGLSEVLYAFASGMGNNGSAFAGLNANIPFYNLALAAAMLMGRVLILLPALAIAGSLVTKKINPPSARFPTASPIFVMVLVGVVIMLGALTFFPVLVLGPFLEHLFIHIGNAL
jgi:potassium-transporting ATPase potassium-binding subunit